MIHFLMISGNFGVFSLMVTDIRTDIRTYGHTDGRTDRPSYRDARAHLKNTFYFTGVELQSLGHEFFMIISLLHKSGTAVAKS